MNFVISPNLPQNAKTVLIGQKYTEFLRIPLENRGISVLEVPNNPCVDSRVSGHADLSVLHLGGNKIALAPYLKGSSLSKELEKLNFELFFPESQQGEKYPEDVAFNMCICGNVLFANPRSASHPIVNYLTNVRGLEIAPVKQGYTKCSICVLKNDAIITSDRGIHEKAMSLGISSLNISAGHVELPGFEYGFIGGAAFKLSEREIAFTGRLDNHPDKNKILDFLSLHNLEPVYITEKTVFDIGSVIQIVEK